ncbi:MULTISPECIES: helix-turn-helix domain-containing protein [Enterococcus]|uniref:helix-turn-helix domain-containing protein n=1 Tax=Enterococcus TaxID=1350 RepID=UPI0020907C3D|nr:helix-turn-helix transcriptional regulator [Enterococcus faecium]MCO5433523.1 helix-turn-helix domain-containing protein [Enterococcus faecium]MCO5451554.1 helix-turn-helix domain-containing protein [Enterococcus faecium]
METYERIKQLREERGYTQRDIANAVKLNISVYQKIELGSRPIRENELAVIADFFNVSTDFLLNRTSDPTPPKRSEEDQLGDSILSHFRLNTADMEVADIEELEEELNEYMDFLVQRAKAKKNKK